MTSKVIIRIGEKSEHVDNENFFERSHYRFSKELSVVFVQYGIYFLIVTDQDKINKLYDATAESEESNDYSIADSICIEMIKDYMSNNFVDFNERVEKAIRTSHGIGIKKGNAVKRLNVVKKSTTIKGKKRA